MDDVKVHYNSDKPAQLNALAYTQDRDIEVGPGQELYLPHETWHVVQQMQGRVRPTMQAKGVSINDDPAFEREADLMGDKAANQKSQNGFPALQGKSVTNEGGLKSLPVKPLQRQVKLQAMANLYAPVQMIPRKIGGHWYGSAGQIAGTRYRVVRRYNTQNHYLHHRDTGALLPQIWTLAEIGQIRAAATALNAIGQAGLHDVISELITQVGGGTILNAAIASIRAIGARAYVDVNAIPTTAYNIVRGVNSTQHRIEDTAAGTVLLPVMDVLGAAAFTAAFANLVADGVINLDGLVRDAAKAVGLGVPIEVTTARLNRIQANVHNVIRTRIAADHAAIRGMLANTIDAIFANAFQSIEIPGSDPHKGGQVVAFINYQTIAGGTARIVYKPGDLTMDRLLYDSAVGIANTLGGDLSTYQIQDMPPDALAGANPNLAHYGYMEFVSTGGPTTAPQLRSVYRSLGSNLAMAYVYGMRDIHGENFVLLNDRIQFIDMEATTNTYSDFNSMEITGSAVPFPGKLVKCIVSGLGGVSHNIVQGWGITDANLQADMSAGFAATFAGMQTGGANDAAVATNIQAVTHTETRFVPFATTELQQLAGLFFGRLAAPILATTTSYNNLTDQLATTTAANAGGHHRLKGQLLRMLRSAACRNAFDVGDVPYWTRRGRSIYGEDGVRQVRRLRHSRLNRSNTNEANANIRRGAGNAANAQNDFDTQAVPLFGTPITDILAAHLTLRQQAGHLGPNY